MATASEAALNRAARNAGLCAGAGVLVAGIGWAGLVTAPRAALSGAVAEAATLDARLNAARALPPAPDYGALETRVKTETRKIDEHLATLGEATELAHKLRALALQSGLEVRSEGPFANGPEPAPLGFRANGHGPPQHYRKRFGLGGDYRSLKRFVAQVEALPDLLRVTSLELKRASSGPLLEIELELDVAKAAPTGGPSGKVP